MCGQLFTCLLAVWALMVVRADAGFRPLDLDEAMKQARTEKKWVFIDFYVTWCRPCKQMDEVTWKSPEVLALLQDRVIAIRVNSDEFPELAKKYNVRIHPTLAFVSPESGQLQDLMVGYIDPSTFKKDFADALAGIPAAKRAETKWKAAGENNPMARLEYAKTLEFIDQLDLALEQYAWAWDEGLKHQPAFALTRRTFLLSEWSRLAKTFPPARKALEKRLEETEKKIAAGDENLTQERAALKRFLEVSKQ